MTTKEAQDDGNCCKNKKQKREDYGKLLQIQSSHDALGEVTGKLVTRTQAQRVRVYRVDYISYNAHGQAQVGISSVPDRNLSINYQHKVSENNISRSVSPMTLVHFNTRNERTGVKSE